MIPLPPSGQQAHGLPLALTQAILRAWERRFANRLLPYAVQQADGTYRWRYQACTLDDLAAHLYGETTLALSSTDGHGHCRWLCLDSDAPDAQPRLLSLRDALADRGLAGLVEGSRRGGHLWLFFDRPLAVPAARGVLLDVLSSLTPFSQGLGSYELYPDATQPGMLGHAVRLPLGVHLLTGLRYPLYDAAGQPCYFSTVRQAAQYLVAHPRLSAKTLRARWRAIHARTSAAPTATPLLAAGGQVRRHIGTYSQVIRWVDANVSPLDLLADLAPDCEMKQAGQGYLGWCPFHDDHAPDTAGKPGTPSFYVVRDRLHGWSWKCFSTNCHYSWGVMRHSFELFQRLLDLSVKSAIVEACRRWPEADQDQRPTQAGS